MVGELWCSADHSELLAFFREWLFWADEALADRRRVGRDGRDYYVLTEADAYTVYSGWWSGTLIDPLN